MKKYSILLFLFIPIFITGCMQGVAGDIQDTLPDRESKIPEDAIKMLPEDDLFPPVLHSTGWEEPVPMPSVINSRGAEDSPFITPDGNDFYFFYTPDVSIPPENQLTDEVTGIYHSKKVEEQWTNPERVVLRDRGKLSLDGCNFIQDGIMWFCSAREGNLRSIDIYTAELKNGKWANWKNAGKLLNVDYYIGELHITSDGSEMYFHTEKSGGIGGIDIWVTRRAGGQWQPPENVSGVNTEDADGWPFLNQDGNELWITRPYKGTVSLFRSRRNGGTWSEPELIISQFAGEASLDIEGNLYFTHHFFDDGGMIEADIYVAYKK